MYFPLARRQRDSGPKNAFATQCPPQRNDSGCRGRDRYEPRSHMTVDDDGVGPSYLLSWRWADDGHTGAASSSRSSRQACRLELACPTLLVGKRSLMGSQLYGLH
mmetsp:Transcript_1026/g.2299  ORF Transcript_1026/g.2299 Transcript_1026/m.2299 type:complete len:105 (+) Transcript_1026:274-588(+)